MGMTGTMKGYSSAARFKAEAAGHRMKLGLYRLRGAPSRVRAP